MAISNVPVFVLTNPKHHWLLDGFFGQVREHWTEQPITVLSYGNNPGAIHYQSLGKTDPGLTKWSNSLIAWLKRDAPPAFILMLEDYWLVEPVKRDALQTAIDFFHQQPHILRLDLSVDRASKRQCRDHQLIKGVQFIKSPPHTPYQMSFQAGIWSRDRLLQALVPGENPWQIEVDGSKRLTQSNLTVFGTRNRPLPYVPVYRGNKQLIDLRRMPNKKMAMQLYKRYLIDYQNDKFNRVSF